MRVSKRGNRTTRNQDSLDGITDLEGAGLHTYSLSRSRSQVERDRWWYGPLTFIAMYLFLGLYFGVALTGHWRGIVTWAPELVRFLLGAARRIPL
jgi:hypothetical protein